MQLTEYIGITIGPIYETICLSSTPAALWAASFMFSHIAHRICEEIVDLHGKEVIISPCVDGDISKADEGIGLFHDRIIFESKAQDDLDKIDKIFEKIKGEVADKIFPEDETAKEWMNKYIQLHAVAYESDSKPITDSSKYLDVIELEKTFACYTVGLNPLQELFEADKMERNKRIRTQIRDTISEGKWPLSKDKNKLPDMKAIIGKEEEKERKANKKKNGKGEKPEKSYSYYAIVQSDGDSFTEYIANHEKLGKSRNISKKCLKFCSEAAAVIQEYGGVTIYAGGDDLLFIAPLWEKPDIELDKRRSLLNLVDDLRKIFGKTFAWDIGNIKTAKTPTISFGIVVRYYKYPLYEAFDEARKLLNNEAKKNVKKNAMAVSLKKHSAQRAEFVIENLSQNDRDEQSTIPNSLSAMIEQQMKEEFLNSISTKIWKFKPLFEKALFEGTDILSYVFYNTFDSDIHAKYESQLKKVKELLMSLESSPVRTIEHESICKKDKKEISSEEKKLRTLDALLRFIKFFTEAGEEERDNDN